MKNKTQSQNFLDRIPSKREGIGFSVDENGIVTLETVNKGVFNLLAQKLFKKPRISYIHLDELGSFIWQSIDGEKTVFELGEILDARFKESANPLYERLSRYIQILESYGFVTVK